MRGKGYLLVISVLVGFYTANEWIAWRLICLFWLILLLIWYKQKGLTIFDISLLILVFLFFSHHFIRDQIDDRFELGTEMTVAGHVSQITKATDQYTIFTIEEQNSGEKIQISDFSGCDSRIKLGAKCIARGEIERPNQATNPGQFNYQSYLSNQDVHYQMAVNQTEQVQCKGMNMIGKLLAIRDKQLNYLDGQLSEPTATWVKSLTLGDRTAIDEDLLELFQRWHLTHLLSISGLHVSIVVMILHFILVHIIKLTKETTAQLLVLFLLLYPFLAGGAPSIWRASLVSSMNYLAWYHRHRIQTIDFLSFSFILFLLIKPEWIYHLGFQFSYLTTFAILFSKRVLSQIKHPLYRSAYITTLSFLMTLPIQVHSFYQFNPLSIFVNMFATFYFSVYLIPVTFFTYLSCFLCQPVMRLFDFFIQLTNNFFLFILKQIDQFFYHPIVTGSLSPLFIILFYLTLFYLLTQFEKRKVCQVSYAFISLLLILMTHQLLPYLNPNGKVIVLDIGQADALVIELPYRRGVILYDAGATMGFDFKTSSDRAYQQVIQPYLHYSGIGKIDAVILSHEDSDHIGSLPYILEDFSVGSVITSPYFQWSKLSKLLPQNLDVTHEIVSFGQSIQIADQVFYILGPSRDWQDANDNSLVLYTLFSDQAWLLTGDISEQVELDLAKHFTHLQIDVLSVAHHGSATSSSAQFLDVFNPNVALISVGRDNSFNHPDDQVISRLKERDIKLFRTDQNGAIQFTFQKRRKGGTFFPYIP